MNRNITRIVAIAATLAMGTSLAACGGSSADSSKGHVYFMNNKAEVVDQYKELASMYTKKTGVQVDIQTGAAGTYDATMKSELAKDNAPTMFNVAGFDQFAKYQKYVEPLQDTDVFKLLNDTGKPTRTPSTAIRTPCRTPPNGTASSTTRRSSRIIAPKVMR